MQAKEMKIHLNGLKIYAMHGVLPQENVVGAEYTINLSLTTDFTQAAIYDDLNGTINYAQVYQLIKEEMATPTQLLENVAYRIALRLFDHFPTVSLIQLSINKQNPPMGAQCDEVGVDVTYSR